MKIRKARNLSMTLIVVGFLISLLASIGGLFFSIIGAIVMISALIPHFLYNKCPHCKKQLALSSGDFCPFCGKKIT